MSEQHTPIPWWYDDEGRIWRRPPSDLYENGGQVAGDKPLATTFCGWYGADQTPFPMHANARFIVRAVNAHDELVAAVTAAVRCLDHDHPGGREGEPPNPLVVIADRANAEQLLRNVLAKIKGT